MKIGDYVRTKSGWVCKLDYYDEEEERWVTYDNVFETKVKISSPNIIDVLEEHDFVQMQDRGNRFYEIERDYTGKLSLRDIGWNEYEELDETNIPEIVSIITHEQMERIKYKVG